MGIPDILKQHFFQLEYPFKYKVPSYPLTLREMSKQLYGILYLNNLGGSS